MALPIIPLVSRVTINWLANGGVTAHNVLHINSATATEAQIAAALSSHISSAMISVVPTTMAPESFDIIKLNGTSGSHHFAYTGGAIGAGGSETSPASACIISLGTGQRGSANRGRVFLGPVSETRMANGQLIAGVRASLNTAWATFLTDLTSNSPVMDLVVASYVHATDNAVTSCAAKDVLGTLRRRQDQLR